MKVVCVSCGETIYDCTAVGQKFSTYQVRPEDFVPLDDTTPQPQDGEGMLCPKCGESFVVRSFLGGPLLKLEGDLWWPYPPIKMC